MRSAGSATRGKTEESIVLVGYCSNITFIYYFCNIVNSDCLYEKQSLPVYFLCFLVS